MSSSKIISLEAAGPLMAELRGRGRKIVQSHGVYDLTLPGHIIHLQEARTFGDVLVVTINSDKFVNKARAGPITTSICALPRSRPWPAWIMW